MSRKIKILAVDDEPSVLESYKMILKNDEYELEIANDQESALQKLKENEFDLVITDQFHPGSTGNEKLAGLELLKIIKEKYPYIEVALIVGGRREWAHARAIELGALEYIQKPFMMDEIYNLVERVKKKKKSLS